MSIMLMNGQPAWIWIDLDGAGEEWNLAAPFPRSDIDEIDDDEEDDEDMPDLLAMFPLKGEIFVEIEELIGLPERPLSFPSDVPSLAEINAAREGGLRHLGSDDGD